MSAPVHTPITVTFSADKLDFEFTGESWIQLHPTVPGLKFGGIGNTNGLAPLGLEAIVQCAGVYSVTITHADTMVASGNRFAMPDAMDITLAPAIDPEASPLGGCVYVRFYDGAPAPWSAEL